MSKKIFIAIGGTGGHVFPGYNLARHLEKKNYNVELISDKRGFNFLKKSENLKVSVLPSSPLIRRNFLSIIFSFSLILYSILRSLIFLIFNRPKIIFGMGGYSSFPICFAAALLKIKFLIYENNLIIGKANQYLLPFAKKILVSHMELEGISQKYEYKIFKVGNIIKKEMITFFEKNQKIEKDDQLKILVLGGSQAAKIFAETLPKIFLNCKNEGIQLKIFQHCLSSQNEKLSAFYKNNKIDFEIFNFSDRLEEYFSKVNLAITRSGSSVLAELTNANIPFISVPLPSSADNHQLKNAFFYKSKNFSFLVEEKDLNEKLLFLLRDIYKNSSILSRIILNQSQFSDKNVYNNIDQVLEEITNEKN